MGHFLMPLLDFLLHLISFAAPAAFLALALALWARLRWGASTQLLPFWPGALLNFALGALVLALGLVLGGHDGRMGSYTMLVLVMASCQWLLAATGRTSNQPRN